MATVLTPGTPALAVTGIETELKPGLTPLQARVLALRVVVSRLGEEDAWRRWNSRVWRAKIVLEPIFKETWSRQRLVLAVGAARVDEARRLGKEIDAGGHLFHLEPAFDAALDHAMALLDLDRCMALNEIVDKVSWAGVVDVKSLTHLSSVEDPHFPDISSRLATITSLLTHASRDNPWHSGAAL
jgi:hypothetical protein